MATIPYDTLKGGLQLGLGGLNAAVNAGLTDVQIAAATGVSNLQTVIRALAPTSGSSYEAMLQAARGIGYASNAGIIDDTIVQAWTGATAARATFGAYEAGLNTNRILQLP